MHFRLQQERWLSQTDHAAAGAADLGAGYYR